MMFKRRRSLFGNDESQPQSTQPQLTQPQSMQPQSMQPHPVQPQLNQGIYRRKNDLRTRTRTQGSSFSPEHEMAIATLLDTLRQHKKQYQRESPARWLGMAFAELNRHGRNLKTLFSSSHWRQDMLRADIKAQWNELVEAWLHIDLKHISYEANPVVTLANVGNGLKVALSTGMATVEDDALIDAMAKVCSNIRAKKLMHVQSYIVISLGNFLKDMLSGGIRDAETGLFRACDEILEVIAKEGIKSDQPQQFANAGNFLKVVLEKGADECDPEKLRAACEKVIDAIIQGKIDNGETQHIANAGNFLKIVLETGISKCKPEMQHQLQMACGKITGLIALGKLDSGNVQEITNAGNFLKVALEQSGGLQQQLQIACEKVTGLIAFGKIDSGNMQEIVNAGNFLKAVLEQETGGWKPEMQQQLQQLRIACEKVTGLIALGKTDNNNAQGVVSTGNFLRTVLWKNIAGLHQGLLSIACNKVIGLIACGKIDNGTVQDFINAGHFLKMVLEKEVSELDPEMRYTACMKVIGSIANIDNNTCEFLLKTLKENDALKRKA